MKHPFISNRILSLYYGLFWLVMGFGGVLLQTLWARSSFIISVSESISIFVLFPILGASIWYLVKYNGISENDWSRNILFHLVASSILNIIWLYVSFIIAKAFDAQEYLYRTLPSKILTGYLLYVGYVVFFLCH